MQTLTNDDLRYVDDGDGWRVYPPTPIEKAGIQGPLEHITAGGRKTGIWYAIGPDSRTGETKLAWVKWPKDQWTLEEIQNSPQVAEFFTKCNVCHARDQLKQFESSRQLAVQSSPPLETYSPEVQLQYQHSDHRRYSLADVAPKYLPFAVDMVKKLVFNELGDVASTVVISALADIVGGSSDDPVFREAMQSFSDAQIDDLTTRCADNPEYVDKIKRGVGVMYEGYRKDGKILDAMKSSMVRPLDDVLRGAGIETKTPKRFKSRPATIQSSNDLFSGGIRGGGVV